MPGREYLANGPWHFCLHGANIPAVKTREIQAHIRRTEAASRRPEDKLRRYQAAREHLDRSRRGAPVRFAHLRRMHD